MRCREVADKDAERAVALGVVLDGQTQAALSGSRLAPVAPGLIEAQVVVRELTRRVADVSERVRTGMERGDQVHLVSRDVPIDVVRELEKQQWTLRVRLGERA